MKNNINDSKIKEDKSQNEYRCVHCYHTVYIHPSKNKQLCHFCGHYIERNEKYNILHISFISYLERRYYNFKKKGVNI